MDDRRLSLLIRLEKLLQMKLEMSREDITNLQQECEDSESASSLASQALSEADAKQRVISKQQSNIASRAKTMRSKADLATKDVAQNSSRLKQAEDSYKSSDRLQQLSSKRLAALKAKIKAASESEKDAKTALEALLRDRVSMQDVADSIHVGDEDLRRQTSLGVRTADLSGGRDGGVSSKARAADLSDCESRLRESKRRQARLERELQQVR